MPRIGGTQDRGQRKLVAPYASTFVGAGVRQEVFDFGRIAAQTAAADALVESEAARGEVTALDIDFAVEEAFFAVLRRQGECSRRRSAALKRAHGPPRPGPGAGSTPACARRWS